MDKKIIIFGAGKYGRNAYHYFGAERIYAFADNNETVQGTFFLGKPIISFEELKKIYLQYYVVISIRKYNEMTQQCKQEGIEYHIFPMNFPINKKRLKEILFDLKVWEKNIAFAGNTLFTNILMDFMQEMNILNSIKPVIVKQEDVLEEMGGNFVSVNHIPKRIDTILLTDDKFEISQINDYQKYNIVDLFYYVNKYDFVQNKKLLLLKDRFKGKRCFLVGNGPSLTIEDLNTLDNNNEFCFGCNVVYKAFHLTPWRPRAYVYSDLNNIPDNFDEMEQEEIEFKFLMNFTHRNFEEYENIFYRNKAYSFDFLQMVGPPAKPENIRFSDDVSRFVYGAYTVMYYMMQLAVYMGFSEIYLLGVDHFYHMDNYCVGEYKIKDVSVKDHFLDSYHKAGEKIDAPHLEKNEVAYAKANTFAQGIGVKMYNATRGGKLEVFERIDFDQLFN